MLIQCLTAAVLTKCCSVNEAAGLVREERLLGPFHTRPECLIASIEQFHRSLLCTQVCKNGSFIHLLSFIVFLGYKHSSGEEQRIYMTFRHAGAPANEELFLYEKIFIHSGDKSR